MPICHCDLQDLYHTHCNIQLSSQLGKKINHPTYIQFFFHFSNSEVPCWKRSDSEKLTIETFARSNEAVVDFLRKKLSWEEDQLIIRLSPAG
jgi:hypothetical protein